MPRATGRPDDADDVQDHVLGGTADGQGPLDADQHVLVFLGLQRLGGHDVLDFGSPDAECQRTDRAVGRGVRIAANHSHSGQGRALLRTNDVHDPLAQVVHAEFGHAVLFALGVQRIDLKLRDGIRDAVDAVGRGYVVVGDRKVGVQAPEFATGQFQPFEGLGARDFMQQMAVDVEDRRAIGLLANHMGIPKLVVQGFIHGAGFVSKCQSIRNPCARIAPGPASYGKNQ